MDDPKPTAAVGDSRRRAMKKMAAAGAAAWVAPTVLTVQGAAAQSAENPPPQPGPCAPLVEVIECTSSTVVRMTNGCASTVVWGNRPDGDGMQTVAPGGQSVFYVGPSTNGNPRLFVKATVEGPVLFTYVLPVPCTTGAVASADGCVGGASWGCYPPWG